MENWPPSPDASEAKVYTLWTVWADYGATGEGRTISACIVYAPDKESALNEFKRIIHGGDFYALGAEAKPGVIENEFTRFIFSDKVFEFCKRENGKAHINIGGHVHFNFS